LIGLFSVRTCGDFERISEASSGREREVVEIRDLTAFFEDLKKDEKAVVKKLYLSEPH